MADILLNLKVKLEYQNYITIFDDLLLHIYLPKFFYRIRLQS